MTHSNSQVNVFCTSSTSFEKFVPSPAFKVNILVRLSEKFYVYSKKHQEKWLTRLSSIVPSWTRQALLKVYRQSEIYTADEYDDDGNDDRMGWCWSCCWRLILSVVQMFPPPETSTRPAPNVPKFNPSSHEPSQQQQASKRTAAKHSEPLGKFANSSFA